MKQVAFALAALCLSAPATAVTLTFEDGDPTGGAVITTSANLSVIADPTARAEGNVLFVDAFFITGVGDLAAIFSNTGNVAVGVGSTILSFDIYAFTDTTLLHWESPVQALTAGTWTTVTGPLDYLGSGHGAIRADGGFYLDNLALDLVAQPVDPNAPVPEPATWAMLLIGFGLAGAAVRRRGTRSLQPSR